METAPVVQYVMGKQSLWPASLLKFNPEHSDMEPDHCEERVQRYMSQYEDSLAKKYLNLSDDNILPGPAAELLPQLKCDFVQNCLHDLAVISAEVDRYEIRVNEKVLQHNRRLEELAKMASDRGNGFAHDNFGLPVPTSTLKSIQQSFILLIFCWDDPLNFGYRAWAHLGKMDEYKRIEWETHLHFWDDYILKEEKDEMELSLDLNLKKIYQRYLQIFECISLDYSGLVLWDTIGWWRFRITFLTLPLLGEYKQKMWAAQKIMRDCQYNWGNSELSYRRSVNASTKLGNRNALVIGFTIGIMIVNFLDWWDSPCSCLDRF